MTHYIKTYKGTRAEKRAQALEDCKDWLGTKRYRKVREAIAQERDATKTLMSQRKAIRFISHSLCLAGIQGYPAQALALDVFLHGA